MTPKKLFSAANRSYFGYGLACIAYAASERYYNHRADNYYFFIGAVLISLGLFRVTLTAVFRGWLLEAEIVRLSIGISMAGYAVFEWFKYHAIDPLFVSIGGAFLCYGVYAVAQRKTNSQAAARVLGNVKLPPPATHPLSLAEIENIRAKADSGDVGSQRRLGYIYQSGNHGPPKSMGGLITGIAWP